MSKCKSCGEKPQKSRAFPSAVVEINNPEQLVLLRKVVIPASMPEETNPPVIGRYKNVILQYEDTNHLYIYSSDGIPTPIEANIPQEILDRIDTLEADVDNLEADVDNLERDLADETEARQTGDSDLSDRIDGVVDDLADEADARELADERLEDAIDTKQDQLTAGANIAIVDESGVLTISAVDTIYDDTEIRQELADETLARQQADNNLQSEIDTIVASSDVKDIVGTYAELEGYDTSTLGDRDIIKVLQDETQLDQTTYYRWSTSTETFSLIGAEGPYYTKAQTNELLDEKQDELAAGENITIADESGSLVISATDTTYTAGYGLELNGTEFSVDPDIVQDTLTAGDNITIEDESGSLVISATDTTYTAGTGLALNGTQFSVDTTAIATQSDLTAGLATKQDTLTAGSNVQINNNVISATDTTYTHFTGATASTDGVQGLVPGPLAGDEGKFLKADGTWDTVGSSVNVVQTTGTSTTDVMSQNATSRMVFADPSSKTQVQIGSGANAGANTGNATVAIGNGAKAYQYGGDGSSSIYQTAVGPEAVAKGNRSLALGANSSAAYTGSVAVGAGANATSVGQFDIGSQYTAYGYNSSNYRLLTGLYDGQSAHDAATKGQLDAAVNTIDAALDAKQDVLTAGDNITIAEESGALVISSTGGGADVFTTNEWNALWA